MMKNNKGKEDVELMGIKYSSCYTSGNRDTDGGQRKTQLAFLVSVSVSVSGAGKENSKKNLSRLLESNSPGTNFTYVPKQD